MSTDARLIIMAGLPGSGKSTLARAYAEQTGAIWLRIDSLEEAIRRSEMPLGEDDVADAGYRGCAALAIDNLRMGHVVIVDSVNPIPLTRDLWHEAAEQAGVPWVDVEVSCSDKQEHKTRIETRAPVLPGYKMPTWQDVLNREYLPFGHANVIQIDSAGRDIADCLREMQAKVAHNASLSVSEPA
ncbi:MAG: AAA family ATPase [Alphaproteobacteria bacterium]